MISRKNRKLARTAVLAVLAAAAICHALVTFWDVSVDQLLAVILAAILIVGGTALFAFLFASLLQLIRKLKKGSARSERFRHDD